MHVFYVGDELVAGHGDPKALGWTSRVTARTLPEAPEAFFHTLAVPGESTPQMSARWLEEVRRRLPRDEDRATGERTPDVTVVFAIGAGDIRREVSMPQTRVNLADMLDKAAAQGFRPVLVGPPPGIHKNEQSVAELAALVSDAARRRDVKHIDLYSPLAAHESYLTDVATGREHLPGQAGYGLMAWLVLHSGWHALLGLPEDAVTA